MTSEQTILYILAPIAGYLLGSIPFALVIGKARGVDIRTTGSKNIGASNLGRTLGPKFFWYAFLLDAAKGFLPVIAMAFYVRHWNSVRWDHPQPGFPLPSWSPLVTAMACVLGHTFPLWLKFKGGKGVATSFGVVLGFWPLYTLAALGAGLTFVVVLMIYRYISLASIIGALSFAILVASLGQWDNRYLPTYLRPDELRPLIVVAIHFAGLIIIRHRANIARLLKGTEPQIGQRERDKAKFK